MALSLPIYAVDNTLRDATMSLTLRVTFFIIIIIIIIYLFIG